MQLSDKWYREPPSSALADPSGASHCRAQRPGASAPRRVARPAASPAFPVASRPVGLAAASGAATSGCGYECCHHRRWPGGRPPRRLLHACMERQPILLEACPVASARCSADTAAARLT
eukprot:362714-Chlamydomonas_euryale.AAC.1